MASLKDKKCSNCGTTNTFTLKLTGEVFWVRCGRCGFHTSSYPTSDQAIEACINNENYISEHGNKHP